MIESVQPGQLFYAFLKEHFAEDTEALFARFELYLDELFAGNRIVNMVSRRMPKQEYWVYHLLDSLLIINCMDIKFGNVLDFGTGGGLPGIPLKLARPELNMTLLDSVGKKVRCLEEIISVLALKDCKAVWSRLEDFAKTAANTRYDYVLCRSVRLEEAFIEPLYKLLKPKGCAVFYKAHQMDDVAILPDILVHDVSRPEIGTRQIVIAPQRSFGMYLKNRKLG